MTKDPLYIGFEESGVAKVIAAVNHDPKAIESHWANHPNVKHFEEDIRTLDLTELVEYVHQQRLLYPNAKLILHASLECTNFSKAKGGLPRDADSRTLADHLHRYVEALHPDIITIENVVEFMSWGPLDENGKPVSRKNGSDFLRWCKEMCAHGYKQEWRELNSADFGARTSRNRLFGQFIHPKEMFSWPEPTHAKNPGNKGMFDGLKKWEACRPCLDLDDHGTDIFTPGKIKSDKTFERIFAGLVKFVAGMNQKEFLSKYYTGNHDHRNLSCDGPAGVLRTCNSHALVKTEFLLKYNSASARLYQLRDSRT
jgi:DNA (cytosine-5)-methyltransferase 1